MYEHHTKPVINPQNEMRTKRNSENWQRMGIYEQMTVALRKYNDLFEFKFF